jgi:hypothetical protein
MIWRVGITLAAIAVLAAVVAGAHGQLANGSCADRRRYSWKGTLSPYKFVTTRSRIVGRTLDQYAGALEGSKAISVALITRRQSTSSGARDAGGELDGRWHGDLDDRCAQRRSSNAVLCGHVLVDSGSGTDAASPSYRPVTGGGLTWIAGSFDSVSSAVSSESASPVSR